MLMSFQLAPRIKESFASSAAETDRMMPASIKSPMVAPFSGDRMLAALCGGLLAGTGIGIIMLRDGSTGGSEIAARLWQRVRPHMSVGRLLLLVDAAVVLASVLVYGQVESALYAAVTVFLTAQVMDRLIYGGQTAKFALIISENAAKIEQAILQELHRGVTRICARGGYTNAARMGKSDIDIVFIKL
jgi:uncharacterized membrane-anchored protein YitT (DUF2179 family)